MPGDWAQIDKILADAAAAADADPKIQTGVGHLLKAVHAAQCEQDGHLYQVRGKNSPTKLECKRCDSQWGIGTKRTGP